VGLGCGVGAGVGLVPGGNVRSKQLPDESQQ
jgi:hypothetical protein